MIKVNAGVFKKSSIKTHTKSIITREELEITEGFGKTLEILGIRSTVYTHLLIGEKPVQLRVPPIDRWDSDRGAAYTELHCEDGEEMLLMRELRSAGVPFEWINSKASAVST